MTEPLLFLLIVGNYGLGLRRDGLPFAALCAAATAVYWGVRLGGGLAFVGAGPALGRAPVLMSEATMMAVAPFAALCAYAVVRLMERRVLAAASGTAEADASEHEHEHDAESGGDAAADPYPLLPPPGRSPRTQMTRREEWALMLGLVAAGAIMFGHGLATARPFWREDLPEAQRVALKKRADEALRLESRLLDCNRPPVPRERETYRRFLDDTARAGLLRLSSHPARPAEVLANLDRERAEKCAARP
ncbi:MAG TPA: hypothetical protein VGQ83_24940 [Polyangia bacterium]